MRTAPVTIDSNTADLLDVAERAIPFLQAIVDARYAGELLDAVLSVRTELENVLLEDARLAVRKVADAWNLSASQIVEPQSLRANVETHLKEAGKW